VNGDKAQELGLLFVRLFRGLEGLLGDDDVAARAWLITPNTALRAKPLDMIQTVQGLMEAVLYADSRRAKFCPPMGSPPAFLLVRLGQVENHI